MGAQSKGMKTEEIFLHELNILPCTGCRACRESVEHCVLFDDFAYVIERIKQSDLIVIGSPVYMGQVSGQTKIFLDRLYSLRRADRSIRVDGTNKRGVTVAVCGRPDPEHLHPTLRSLSVLFRFLNTDHVANLEGPGLSRIGDAAQNHELMDRAYMLGSTLAEDLLG